MSSTIYTLPGRDLAPATKGEKLAQWFFAHRAQFGLAFGLLVVGSGLGIAIGVNRSKMTERGIEQISVARMQSSQGKRKEALQTLEEVLTAHRTNPVAMQAYILKGEMLVQEKKFGEAAETYQEGFGQASFPAYKALMLVGWAAADVEMQKFPAAIERYGSFVRDFPDHYLVPRCLMELGRLHLAQKQWKEARATCERFLTLFPKSPWAPEAQANLAAAKAQLPPEPSTVEAPANKN
jgi:tetratricopeptide (TPR) repeat protein